MIDKKARRDELTASVKTAENTIAQSRDQINFLNGAITLLNELILDEEPVTIEGQAVDEVDSGGGNA